MAPDPSATSVSALSVGPADKTRLHFRKDGPLRWLSHHDLMRTFERLLRRSELPYRSTRGFNPHPRIVFALALPLGVIGCAEIVEIELDAVVDPEEVRQRLARQCPPGLTILDACRIPGNRTAHVTGFTYAFPLPPDRMATTASRIREALALTHWQVERSKPHPRSVDIRPFLRNLQIEDGRLLMELWLTHAGSARPEEVLRLLEVHDLYEDGNILERLHLELDDETPSSPQHSTGHE